MHGKISQKITNATSQDSFTDNFDFILVSSNLEHVIHKCKEKIHM